MNLIRRAWRWLTTPHRDTTCEDLKAADETQQRQYGWIADSQERERKSHVATLPEPPDLTDDPQTDVPAPHPGVVSQLDISKPLPRGEEAPETRTKVTLSDYELLNPDEQALFRDLGHVPGKTIAYPAPTELSTQEWVTEQLAKAGFSQAYHARFAAWRRVGVGMSMRYLGELKARADRKDPTLTVHQLLALRSRGIS